VAVRHLLVHPPFADPTQPYLSLPTLKGALRARGLDARVIDLNVEAAHYLFERETIETLARRVGERFLELDGQEELDFHEQLQYRALALSRAPLADLLAAQRSPLEVFQQREHFYDPLEYTHARRRTEGLFAALSAVHHPYRFDFNQASHAVVPWSFELLASYAESGSPLLAFYERFFAPVEDWDWSRGDPPPDLGELAFAGISIVFPSQIPEAFALARFLRSRAPHAFLAFGGPCMHQIAIHMGSEQRSKLLAHVDAIGLFEGEQTLVELFPQLDAWRECRDAKERFAMLASVPNLLLRDPATNTPVAGPRHVVDLREAAPPDYSDLDLDRYLAPSRILLYAPTRGCYWDKCSFCYYGLAEAATASYREVPPERAASELARLAQRHGVKNFYMSCDVLAPKYALRLAEALIDKGVKIRWSSDLKIEKYFDAERCARLFEAGLRSAAFGIESGSDRILELMRKGVTRSTMTEVNRAFHAAGVATEWMTFTDHPGESAEEALDTVSWIEEERENVDLFLVGRFGLEAGSHIAQDPARYGVEEVFHAEGDDLRLYALFRQRGGPRSAADEERVDRAVDGAAESYDLHPYPWAGAISTHHTFLHFLELGPRAFRTHFRSARTLGRPPVTPQHATIPGLGRKPSFPLERIAERTELFLSRYLARALSTADSDHGVERDGRRRAALCLADFEAASRRVGPLTPQRSHS
jgi:hypothetical protein